MQFTTSKRFVLFMNPVYLVLVIHVIEHSAIDTLFLGLTLVNQSHKPDGQFLADGEVDIVGKNIGIGDVGDLLERLVFASYLKSEFSINLEVSMVFSVFYRM